MGSSGDRLRQTRLIPRSPDGDKNDRIEMVAKGWLAIAKLKPLSLFISLF